MLIANIIGGLGNQMFQYAAGRALSLKRGDSLRLDVSDFVGYGLHQGFELQRVFGGVTEIASEADVRSVLGWQSSVAVRRILSRPRMSWIRHKHFVVEPHFQYWAEINNVPSCCYLQGYWQSEKYFLDAAAEVRQDFTFRPALTPQNAHLCEQIRQVNAVSLHVRRGDYANNPQTTATHGMCSLDYYRQAIQHVSERVSQPHFFVFSDDMAWVKSNLEISFPCHYVDHNQGAESYNDMRLMSLCQHHIIANSSFSWWGAWLNPRVDKIVIAPKQWFAKTTNVQDLLPQKWVRL